MISSSPITPPPELVQQWIRERPEREYSHTRRNYLMGISNYDQTARQFVFDIATQAAQWGADQELEACIANINTMYGKGKADWLRSMRRPKPPNLKEEALKQLDEISACFRVTHMSDIVCDKIRRALEQL
jgi:hypothetical protein